MISVKYPKHSVDLNHWYNTKCTPDKVNELANTLCMVLFTGLLHNNPSMNILEYLTHSVYFYSLLHY